MITEEHKTELDLIIKKTLENEDLVSEWELDFCNDFAPRMEKAAIDIRVSDKQQYIFDRIQLKLEKAGEL